MATPAGKWDGDTLVIETIGFKDDLWLDAGEIFDQFGEDDRGIRRPNYGSLEIEITIDDPKTYTPLDGQVEPAASAG